MAPKPPKSNGTSATIRQSPRKRKQDDIELDFIPEPSRHELKSSDAQHCTEGSAVEQNKPPRPRKKTKADIILDEPGRTDVLAERNEDGPDSTNFTTQNKATDSSKKKKSIRAPKHTKADDSSSDLSSIPDDEGTESKAAKVKRKRKTKEQKEAEDMPLAPRTTGLNMFVGAHVSIAKGVENAITNAVHIGGNALALFLQSQRKWENPDLKPGNRDAFIHACSHHGIDAKQHIVPHGSYLVNLAAKDTDQAKKSYDFFLKDLKRCEALGIKYYNFHPGATNKDPLPEAITRLATLLDKALSETETVVPLLENMAGTETIIGSRFSDLAQVIAKLRPEHQNRIGICIDTCHTFAAGYDLRTPEAFQRTFQELDDVVGLKYLKALHLNDSKGMFGSKKDLHQNIGLGFLGLRAFHSIMNEPRLTNIPMILETPCERPDPKDSKKTIDDKTVYAREIKLLESLIGMDPESAEYKKLESDLAKEGEEERDKMAKWQAEKEKKERDKAEKARKKIEKAEQGQQSIAGMLGGKGTKNKKRNTSSSGSESE
ncbi:DNA-(apurinic or apyrimidinic site) lyase [Lithohypha guttulata]|uniref:Apurinic-apyrimidinic endonuclease 1 n=1 Tax=Lithohypha guttulata TaxID=1690604 RepID=A0AAN7YES4_9EURO|nr:DNA-(apurinic or apyrimidinic site) lyase [Lithohypha guttulata]